MALPPGQLPGRPARRDHPGTYLRGEDPLSDDDRITVDLRLTPTQAQKLHDLLEDDLEANPNANATARDLLRLLSWRILAARGGSGLTGRLAELARAAPTLEDFETARDRELGPILDALENHQNRDP